MATTIDVPDKIETPDVRNIEPRRFTRDEYYKMAEVGILDEDERVELIEGVIAIMSPIGRFHRAIVSLLARQLTLQLRDEFIVQTQSTTMLSEALVLEPDLVVFQADNALYAHREPTVEEIRLVIEVMDTSQQRDRRIKLPLYAKSGVKEVWLIDVNQQTIEKYEEPTPEGYRSQTLCKSGDSLQTKRIASFEMTVDELFAPLNLRNQS